MLEARGDLYNFVRYLKKQKTNFYNKEDQKLFMNRNVLEDQNLQDVDIKEKRNQMPQAQNHVAPSKDPLPMKRR